MRNGSARKRQRGAPIRSRLVRYSMTVIPAGKNTSWVTHSWRSTLVLGEKMVVRMHWSGG
jgi:hypothetical protein